MIIPIVTLLLFSQTHGIESARRNCIHETGLVVWDITTEDSTGGFVSSVICLHGTPFSGTLSAGQGGGFTQVSPKPHFLHGNRGGWYLSSADLLSYECDSQIDLWSLFLEESTPEYIRATWEIPQALFFSWDGSQYLMENSRGVLYPLNMTVNPNLAEETITRWADSLVESDEIEHFWNTWKPLFTEGENEWLVFPIPGEYNSMISSVNLETLWGSEIECRRFFIGAVKLNQL